jgi:hypothetical protein
MSVDMEAAPAVAVVGGQTGRIPHACANCGALLQGAFCHLCGQSADPHHRSIWHLALESLEDIFHADGRLLRTLPSLFLFPGRLARDLMEGRRARHVPPFRLFLVSLVLFIFAAEHAVEKYGVAAREKAAVLSTPQGRQAEASRLRTEAVIERDRELKDSAEERDRELPGSSAGERAQIQEEYARETRQAQQQFARDMAEADAVARGEGEADRIFGGINLAGAKGWLSSGLRKANVNPDYYFALLFTWVHRAAFLLLPIMGLTLALAYVRQRKFYLYDHMLVAMNLLSFAFIVNAAGFLLWGSLQGIWFGLLTLWVPVNLFQTLRGGYGSSALGAVFKTLLVWAVSGVSFAILVVGLMLYTLHEI